jgi:pimeloyl-ACP methyl ester carboxylesterase
MRRYPASIRSVVLDSVVPPEHVLGMEIAVRSQNSLDKLFERCEKDEACKEKIPNLKGDVESLFEKLKHAPVSIKVENFSTGKIETLDFTREHLMILVRMYLYNSYSLAVMPPMLHEAAANNNYAPLARAANGIVDSLGGALSTGLHNSVMCTEEAPFYNPDEESIKATQKTYMGMDILNLMRDVCSVWPKGKVGADMKAPLESDIPTLLFSGEFDPITPPEYAETTMQKLTQAKHFILKGQGHGVSATGCAPDLVDKFVSDASSEWLNSKCLDRLSAAPLYINFNGSAP